MNETVGYQAVLILILVAIGMALSMVVLTHLLGPRRRGPVKDGTYESGMPVIGNARRRFNVRFYLVAMLFLLFDVEVVFLWPWAPLFHDTAKTDPPPTAVAMIADGFGKGFLLAEMAVFLGILLTGYVYAWRKGVFRWN